MWLSCYLRSNIIETKDTYSTSELLFYLQKMSLSENIPFQMKKIPNINLYLLLIIDVSWMKYVVQVEISI